MKKIVSMLMVFVAVMAFSGLAMAEPVSAYSIKNVGSKTVTNGDVQYIHHWYLKYFSKNQVKFYFTTNYREYKYDSGYYDTNNKYIPSGHWVNTYRITYVSEYKKVYYHHLKVTDSGYFNGKKVGTEHKYVKTSKTAYQRFKSKKTGLINYYMSLKN